MNNDIEIFPGKNFSDLLQEIHAGTVSKRSRIDGFILEMRRMMTCIDEAVVLAPIIASYLDIMVRNDDHLIKIAAIVQKIIALEAKGKSGDSLDGLLSEAEKAELMKQAFAELEKIAEEKEDEPLQIPIKEKK